MREKVLKALMQLFAIIVGPRTNNKNGRQIVETFLRQQLRESSVGEYLELFDGFYAHYQRKQSENDKKEKNLALNSVKVLKICTQINEDLDIRQKMVVMIRLLEFIKSGTEVSEQELEFVQTVSESFFFSADNFNLLKDFVLSDAENIPVTPRILLIDGQKASSIPDIRHLYHETFHDKLWVLYFEMSNMYLIRKFGTNELYLNGQIVIPGNVYVLNQGASLRDAKMKPIYYSDIVNYFFADEIGNKIQFVVKDVEYYFKGGTKGLNSINMVQESGSLVGIMGASGSGKTTLLNVLNGSCRPTSGTVTINGIDIYDEKEKVEGLIGYVSQDDLLVEELTVYQNLLFNARLCFDDLSEFQIRCKVLKVLKSLGLFDIKDMVVGSPLNKKISGGQRKRLNIALELIREPAILFLDEPTSGLSSRDSENIMDILKEMALKGKLVFTVIHQPSSDIFKMFDNLYILDKGGYLIYDGNPVDSIIYFKTKVHQANWNDSECHTCGNVNPEQIFNIVESQMLDEYGNLTPARRLQPEDWFRHFQEARKTMPEPEMKYDDLPENASKIPSKFKQFRVFVERDVLSKISNRQYMVINILESPVLAFLLAFIIRYFNETTGEYSFFGNANIPVYIFMAVIVAIFIGLSVSAEEIVKDRKIQKRERFLNLSRTSYLFSKMAILLVISAIQAFMFVAVGNLVLGIQGMFFYYWFALFSSWFFSCLLGLNISDSFDTVVTIYILIPFLVIPQLIMSGIIVPFDKLNPAISNPEAIPAYGEIITARWAYEALAVQQFKENEFERDFYEYNKMLSQCDFRKNYWMKTIENKVTYCRRNYNNPSCQIRVKKDLELLRNELNQPLDAMGYFQYDKVDRLYLNRVTPEIFDNLEAFLGKLKTYYYKQYNHVNNQKDQLINSMQRTDEERAQFVERKRRYSNENLTSFVRNSTSLDRIIEHNGHLYQKSDPIYLDPSHPFIKAHFYAPCKNLFGRPYPTYWVNMMVIWFFSLVMYITLKFRLLRKAIEWFSRSKV